jgi:hypothetical protein
MTDDNHQVNTDSNSNSKPAAIDMSVAAVQDRLNMVWQLTIEEYAKKGIDITKQPMRKDVERLIRKDEYV